MTGNAAAPGVAQLDRPSFLRQLCTDEYSALRYTTADLHVIRRVQDTLHAAARERGVPVRALANERVATAAGLRALNAEHGDVFYDVPESATAGGNEAAEVFDGNELVIDVQTHYMAPHSKRCFPIPWLRDVYRQVMPSWWRDLDEEVSWDLSYYLTNVFPRSETAIAVLTSTPGTTDVCPLFNDEIFATRVLVDNLAGTGRLFNHAVVHHARTPAQRHAMQEMAERYDPVGWKVYTMGAIEETGWEGGWSLDDETSGQPFLQQATDLDINLICVHKGLAQLAQNGEPNDVGPAARRFPNLNFVIYHSGYEFPIDGTPGEGAYTEEAAHLGVNRLIKSLHDSGLGKNSNVYAELGTTWFTLIRRPEDAAHVLGKLIKNLGADNIIWGTDGIWYGHSQPIIDAFRTFQIPDRMCEEFGYEKISPLDREKILSLNAARVYGFDLEATRRTVANDDLAWAREAVAEYRRTAFPALRL
jgi:hypothetical protein